LEIRRVSQLKADVLMELNRLRGCRERFELDCSRDCRRAGCGLDACAKGEAGIGEQAGPSMQQIEQDASDPQVSLSGVRCDFVE
jgi:hypothetical protein